MRKNLRPVNVTAQHCIEFSWELTSGDDVGATTESEIRRSDLGAFDSLLRTPVLPDGKGALEQADPVAAS